MTDRRRLLIVNADDFGRSSGINRGVVRAHEEGIVTSASLMVRWPAAVDAAAYARARAELSVGLHVDLAEWRFDGGEWRPVYEVASSDADAIETEVAVQLERFRELVGRDPTHLDSHQHVHRAEPVRSVIERTAELLDVPLRDVRGGVAYCGSFYGQTATGEPIPRALDPERLIAILRELPPGSSELACHPGELDDELESVYRIERPLELETLCAPEIRATLAAEGIVLCSFATLPAPSTE
jgi:predicted glycoside hydrolase/deacetylase ChbG (UPF0249 family)